MRIILTAETNYNFHYSKNIYSELLRNCLSNLCKINKSTVTKYNVITPKQPQSSHSPTNSSKPFLQDSNFYV